MSQIVRAGRRPRDQVVQVEVGGPEVAAAVDEPRHHGRVPTEGHEHLGEERRQDAVEPGEGPGGQVARRRAGPGGQHRGQRGLVPRLGVGGVPQDAAAERHEHAGRDQAAALLAGDADAVEVGSGHEAELLAGPLGDGPVQVTGHDRRPYERGVTAKAPSGSTVGSVLRIGWWATRFRHRTKCRPP